MNKQSVLKFGIFHRSRSGFTLLEILIAIFIFAIIISTVYGSFNAVISRTEAINNGVGAFEMARVCLNRMMSDLNAIYVEQKPLYHKPDYNDPPDPYRFVGKETFEGVKTFSQLRFASFAHLSMSKKTEKGIAEIVYYVEERGYPESEYVLKRSDTLYSDDEDYEFEEKDSDPVLCEGLEELSFAYFDDEGNEYERWDSDADSYKNATPRAIGITLTINYNSEIHTFYTKLNLPVYREKFK
ncbi:MAG: prepilin-type N-terminal cleavage/methylation domain-containing protein [Dissulfuribacterales bacterium]